MFIGDTGNLKELAFLSKKTLKLLATKELTQGGHHAELLGRWG